MAKPIQAEALSRLANHLLLELLVSVLDVVPLVPAPELVPLVSDVPPWFPELVPP
jgi:hypothetical protein